MNFSSDITEQYLDKIYEDFNKEQMRLLTNIKTGVENKYELDLQKQFTLLNNLMMGCLRLRNLKKKIKNKLDN